MSAIEAIVLGLVQGLTEFLPISSSGHLRIVPAFFGWDDPGSGVHRASSSSARWPRSSCISAATWRGSPSRGAHELRVPFRARSHEANLGWFIILGTIPISVFGLIFSDQIESGARDLYLIGSALILFSFVMLLADRFGSRRRELTELNMRDGLFIGFAQALALIPGVSRSGATISAGLFRNLDGAAAARYSFLLSVPAVVLSGLFEMRDDRPRRRCVGRSNDHRHRGGVHLRVCGDRLAASLPGDSHPRVFIAYRIPLGVLVLALAATGTIS